MLGRNQKPDTVSVLKTSGICLHCSLCSNDLRCFQAVVNSAQLSEWADQVKAES